MTANHSTTMADEKSTTDDESTDTPSGSTPLAGQEDTEWAKYTPHATLGVDSGFFHTSAHDLGDAPADGAVDAEMKLLQHDDTDARVALRVQLAAERDGHEVVAGGCLEFTPEQARGLARRLEEIAEFVEDGDA